jgi:hypothetical protein
LPNATTRRIESCLIADSVPGSKEVAVKAMSTAASTIRHTFVAGSEALILAAIVAALLFGAAVLTGHAPLGAGSTLAGQNTSTLSVPDGSFGGTTMANVSMAGSAGAASTSAAGLWVHATCIVDANGSLGLVAWETTDASGNASIALGPTPSWQSGSATCKAEAGSFDKLGRFKASSKTTFSVSE